jgi:hypothetical protein
MEYTSEQVAAVEEARKQIDHYGFSYVSSVAKWGRVSEEAARWALLELCTPPDEDTDETVATYQYRLRLSDGEEREIWWSNLGFQLARRVPAEMLRFIDPERAKRLQDRQKTYYERARRKAKRRVRKE